jgi:hypothetical protein
MMMSVYRQFRPSRHRRYHHHLPRSKMQKSPHLAEMMQMLQMQMQFP